MQVQMEKDYQVRKLLNQKCEEEIIISRAKYNWAIIKKKIKVIRMMGKKGEEDKILEMIERKQKQQDFEDEQIGRHRYFTSKFIIPPNNYWKILWNNLVLILFIVYIIMLPLFISYDTTMKKSNLSILLMFDILFMIDRIGDLFLGYFRPDGQMETSLSNVLY